MPKPRRTRKKASLEEDLAFSWPDAAAPWEGKIVVKHKRHSDSFIELSVGVGVTRWRAVSRGVCCIARGMIGNLKEDRERAKSQIEQEWLIAMMARGWT